ncbi:proline-rich protein [Sesbania bispinosa]|nr:proline-rich protein [Sesbania bispinosa]
MHEEAAINQVGGFEDQELIDPNFMRLSASGEIYAELDATGINDGLCISNEPIINTQCGAVVAEGGHVRSGPDHVRSGRVQVGSGIGLKCGQVDEHGQGNKSGQLVAPGTSFAVGQNCHQLVDAGPVCEEACAAKENASGMGALCGHIISHAGPVWEEVCAAKENVSGLGALSGPIILHIAKPPDGAKSVCNGPVCAAKENSIGPGALCGPTISRIGKLSDGVMSMCDGFANGLVSCDGNGDDHEIEVKIQEVGAEPIDASQKESTPVEVVPETQLQSCGGLGPDYNSDLFAESNLCEVPITAVESLAVLWRKPSSIPVCRPKKRRGRPRKMDNKLQVSDPILLNKVPHEVARSVWNIGLQLVVSGGVAEDTLITRLTDMETRDRIAIGRSSGNQGPRICSLPSYCVVRSCCYTVLLVWPSHVPGSYLDILFGTGHLGFGSVILIH